MTYKVKYLTIYSFSTENWTRPAEEVRTILDLLVNNIDKEAAVLHKNGVQMRHLGRLEELSPEVQAAIQRACHLTRNNRKMVFSFAFNYGGRTEIIDAVRHLIQEKATAESITDDAFKSHLYAPDIPDVDLLIRTSGELRISSR